MSDVVDREQKEAGPQRRRPT